MNKNSLVIYGVNGWVGKAFLDFLVNQTSIPVENIYPISSSTSKITLLNGRTVKCYNISEILELELKDPILISLGFKGQEQVKILGKSEYDKQNKKIIETNIELTEKLKPSKMVYLSSGAAKNSNDSYGLQKAESEDLFSKLSQKHNFKLLIARLYNIAGPYINKMDNYAISSFIKQALENKEIIIKANHAVIRSYIHIYDFIELIYRWLDDKNAENFSFETNVHSLELEELAEKIVTFLGTDIKITRLFDKNLEADYYVGSSENQKILQTRYNIDFKDLDTCIEDTYEYVKDKINLK